MILFYSCLNWKLHEDTFDLSQMQQFKMKQRQVDFSFCSAISPCSKQVIPSVPFSAYICGEMQVKHEIKSIQIFKWLSKKQ